MEVTKEKQSGFAHNRNSQPINNERYIWTQDLEKETNKDVRKDHAEESETLMKKNGEGAE